MSKLARILATTLGVIVLGAGLYWLYQNYAAPQPTAQAGSFQQVVAAQRGNLSASISVVGELYAPQSQAMSFNRMAGAASLATLDFAAGNRVSSGQVIATIDPSSYQQALDQARSDLQEAQARLTVLLTPPTDLAIAQSDLAVAKGQLALQQALSDLNDLLNPDMSTLQANVANAQVALVQAQVDLTALQSDATKADTLTKLKDTEASRSSDYSRLANESYSDNYYQDRLRVAHNALLDAQDARQTAEIQQQVNSLKAQMQARIAQKKLSDAQTALIEAQVKSNQLAVAEAQQGVAQAEADVAKAKEDRMALDAGADRVAVTSAQADVAKKQLAVANAEADLAGATMRAPFDGTILQTNEGPGARITASSTIMTLADLNDLQVIASVDETTVRQVSAGQAANVTFDALPDRSFSGEVLSVPLQGTLQGGIMVYDVPISLIGVENLPLLVGMTANVAIQVGQVENALLVPTMAIQNVGGLYQVMVPNSADPTGQGQSVPVEVGLNNGTYTQIVRGLNQGDQVVIQLSAANNQSDFQSIRQLVGGGGGQGQRRGN